MKNTITELKIRKGFKLNNIEERISILEDRTLRITQKSKKEKKKMKKCKENLWELQNTVKRKNIHIMGIPEEKERQKVYLKQ